MKAMFENRGWRIGMGIGVLLLALSVLGRWSFPGTTLAFLALSIGVIGVTMIDYCAYREFICQTKPDGKK